VVVLHDPQGLFGNKINPREICFQNIIPPSVIGIINQIEARKASVVDENVDGSPGIEDFSNGPLNLLFFPDVCPDGQNRMAQALAPPSARALAVALPMPVPPPVTIATLPDKAILSSADGGIRSRF
jgi:hypothetical protein